MELYLLRYFLAVVETGSFTKAAGACLITQPTLSAGIKRLEDQIGVALFIRNNKRVSLTTAGARFLPRAKAILHEVNMASAEIAQTDQADVLRLGVLQTLPSAFVARLLAGFSAAHPGIRFDLFDGTEQELLNRLDERGIDFALSLRRVEDDTSIALFEEGYQLALSRQHRLAAERIIRGEDLANESMIVRSRCEVLSETSRHFTDRNVRPPLVYRTAQDERALSMVGAGVGITVMPESYTAPDVVRIPMQGFNPRRTVALFLPRFSLPQRLQNSAEAFTGFTKPFYRRG
ncbi:LysR family transcriptional regulator [Asticcacaulis benevestitus]|uniref:LysR family transcriptional regulator n=1 Tax=Asticcacaulis benevestitus DSM 16100 = ATCC BAA-896 TaxID=1121022 RepID=V4PSD9_9CAUL|nr:LysR family transcriptional regulator [Asticcacaulis benevestitus]ESQ90269.1 LysR family transcriptional regulator [Asticcacaulis benevestitus DSM 16100 = ATCC BAA-896]